MAEAWDWIACGAWTAVESCQAAADALEPPACSSCVNGAGLRVHGGLQAVAP